MKHLFKRNIAFLIFSITQLTGFIYGQIDTIISKQPINISLPKGCTLSLNLKNDLTGSVSGEILKDVQEIIPKIQKLIPADSITINISETKENIIPLFGMGGSSSNNRVDLFFDPTNSNFKVNFMMASLAHEISHVIRLRMPGWKLTLLECMVTEGIADHFSIEVTGCEQPVWTKTLSKEQIEQNLNKVKPVLFIEHKAWDEEFTNTYFNPWMFGRNGEDPIPGWTGYSLGWEIVENYLVAHPGIHSSDIVWKPAEDIAVPILEKFNKE